MSGKNAVTGAAQYREVKRKANVGERIKTVAAQDGDYAIGDILTVTDSDRWGDGEGVSVREVATALYHYEYVVLEPVPSAEPDALAASFRQFVLDNADAIRAILPELETQLSGEPPVRKPDVPRELSRAAVIAKATADVAELQTQNHPGVGDEGAWFTDTDGSTICDRAEFVVNREKRTVTALLRYVAPGEKDDNKVWRRATAKAAPDDVFHAEIGKAIALRRALGLTVPNEYVNAPKPEPRMGAVVDTARGGGKWTATLTSRRKHMDGEYGKAWSHSHDMGWIGEEQFAVIDDTDVDYGAVGTEVAA